MRIFGWDWTLRDPPLLTRADVGLGEHLVPTDEARARVWADVDTLRDAVGEPVRERVTR